MFAEVNGPNGTPPGQIIVSVELLHLSKIWVVTNRVGWAAVTIRACALCIYDVAAQTYKMNVLTPQVQFHWRNDQADADFAAFFLPFCPDCEWAALRNPAVQMRTATNRTTIQVLFTISSKRANLFW